MAKSNTHILDMLLADGMIDKVKYQKALYHQKTHDDTIEDALIETGAVEEESLLKKLAHIYRTRYVATNKLKRAEIPRAVLDTIPPKLAIKHTVFPILFNNRNGELAIVTADPSDVMMEQEISQASGIPRIRSMVARPKAIKAAIAKFYRGDIHAFARLDSKEVKA